MKTLLLLGVVLITNIASGQLRTPAGRSPARVLQRIHGAGGREEVVVAFEDSFLDARGHRVAYVDPVSCVITQRVGNRYVQSRSECLPSVRFASIHNAHNSHEASNVQAAAHGTAANGGHSGYGGLGGVVAPPRANTIDTHQVHRR